MNGIQGRSPYRSSSRARQVRKLSFFHTRFVFGGLLGVLILLAASSCVITPRTITVECRPKPDPVVECISSARPFWGGAKVLKSRIRALDPGEKRGFDALEIDTRYVTRLRTENHELIQGRFRPSYDWTEITEPYPLSTGWLDDFFRFRDRLRAGKPATLVYRSGWGGLLIAIPLAVCVILLLWPASGSSSVVYRVDERIVDTGSKNFWHSRTEHRRLSRDDIEDAVVTTAPDTKDRTVFRPALRLENGEIVHFGIVGGYSAERPEHLVRQIRELLELPEGPIARVDQSDAAEAHSSESDDQREL